MWKFYGSVCSNGISFVRKNNEISDLYMEIHIVTSIRIRRLHLLGHVMRMEDAVKRPNDYWGLGLEEKSKKPRGM